MNETTKEWYSKELQGLRAEVDQAMAEFNFAESESASLAAMRHLNSVFSRMNDLIKRAKATSLSEAVASAIREMD